MKAAPGTGIISSIVLESDDLDEIDWVGQDTLYNILDFSLHLTLNSDISGSRWWRHDPDRIKLLRKGRHHDLRPRDLASCLEPTGGLPHLHGRLDQGDHHLVRGRKRPPHSILQRRPIRHQISPDPPERPHRHLGRRRPVQFRGHHRVGWRHN